MLRKLRAKDYPTWSWDHDLFEQSYIRGEDDECWQWIGKIKNTGLPLFYSRRAKDGCSLTNPQRIVIALNINRPLLPTEAAYATCGNHKCMNPKHLCIGTKDQLHKIEDVVNRTRWPVSWILDHFEEIRSCRSAKVLMDKYDISANQVMYLKMRTKRMTGLEIINIRTKEVVDGLRKDIF